MILRALAIGFAAAMVSCAYAQRLILSSEFVRLRPDGAMVESDRAGKRRELLSPAVARNAHFTFRATVVQPEGAPYTLHIAQNPEDTAEIRLYQEQYAEEGGQWIPDRLKQVEMPHGAMLAQGQAAQSYLVDVFIPASTPANFRFRLEVQFHRGDGWMIYPMEIRVRQPKVEAAAVPLGVFPALSAPLSRAIDAPLRSYLCSLRPPPRVEDRLTGRALLLRNIAEDLDLARQREGTDSRDGVAFMLLKAAGINSLPAFCSPKPPPLPAEPEWWLKVRDYLIQGRPVP